MPSHTKSEQDKRKKEKKPPKPVKVPSNPGFSAKGKMGILSA